MKVKTVLLSLAVIGTLAIAGGVSSSTITSVDTQIQAIQNAPASQRVKLMNQFKEKLMNMNQKERMEAISQLQVKMQGKMQAHREDGQEMGTTMSTNARKMSTTFGKMTQEHSQEHSTEMQMQENEQMTHIQNMNQRQAGNQFVEDGARSGATSQNMNANMDR